MIIEPFVDAFFVKNMQASQSGYDYVLSVFIKTNITYLIITTNIRVLKGLFRELAFQMIT